ncbi:hypothetical protein COU77_02380 [Candidatus Peregrinibacteria bacterium CG10_big_fil_rev_8_21_14_0_10_49_16]|nr:MAG: hypothetical protein COW95_00865 [Candidatus Peregrinibacteria bacterium CG22_combo_CG10-13_8_21_14_all_49_11]PIR52058.1 MAG: hypothetical protein COU77_02380 [Candidatus Peregrinibacteria bacterium CG10_big_fil_rev_8_21_14_0_10_49_16]
MLLYMNPTLFLATKAFIEHEGKVLILREAEESPNATNKGKYHMPGGRIHPGEKWQEALRREVREETALEIEICSSFFVTEWRPVVRGEKWHIIGIFFNCLPKHTDVVLGEEHDDYQWIDPKTYKDYPLIENLHPVFETYLQLPLASDKNTVTLHHA